MQVTCIQSERCSQVAAIVGAATVIAGVFLILAAQQVLPNGVNAISQLGAGGIGIGATVFATGTLVMAYGLIKMVIDAPAKARGFNSAKHEVEVRQFFLDNGFDLSDLPDLIFTDCRIPGWTRGSNSRNLHFVENQDRIGIWFRCNTEQADTRHYVFLTAYSEQWPKERVTYDNLVFQGPTFGFKTEE